LTYLSPLDIGCFVFYMALLIGVGVYFTRQQRGLKSYLLADQNIHWIIVAVSVLAALFSGITYLGAPAQTYYNDLSYLWVIASFFIATPITTLVFLPFFRSLNLFTAYEYLDRRFDWRLQRIASVLFITRICFHLGLAIYAPALAIMAITGWPLWLSIVLTGTAATLYTTLGGMKAVIWTDTLQFIVLCGGIVLVLCFAIAEIPGGLPAAWGIAEDNGRTKFIDLTLDPKVPMGVWAALLGGASINLIQMVTDQISVQRYLTAPSLKDSQRALWFKLWVTMPLLLVFCLSGTMLFSYYRTYPNEEPLLATQVQEKKQVEKGEPDSPPERQGRLTAKDQILPYFVVNQLPSPIPGILIAAIFGATMAVASAGINSLATTTLMDFGSRQRDSKSSQARQVLLARGLTILYGILVTLLALGLGQVNKTLVDSIFIIQGVFGGPLLGIFFLGVLSRRANGSGALIGAAGGSVAGILVAFSGALFGYPISSLWIAFTAAGITFLLGLLASLVFVSPGPEQQALVYRWGTGASKS
jgi:sodium-coupled monocarboxylate transporter 8/12